MPFGLLAAAILGSSAIGAGTSLLGASQESQAANLAAQIQEQMFNKASSLESSYISAGTTSLGQLQALLGQGGGGTAGELSALQATPGYQFTLQQGLQALTDQATATGGVGGGNTLKALMSYGSGLADQTYQQAVTNAQNLVNTGAGSANALAGLAYNTGTAVGSDITGSGNALAAGTTGASNATTGGANSLVSNYLLAQLLGGSAAGAGSSIGLSSDASSALAGLF